MTYSDHDLATLVRDQVSHRPSAGLLVDDVVRTGRRRVAVCRGVTALATAAVLAGGTALALVGGLPLGSSAPPAGPSVTLSPDPRRTSAERPVTDMYAAGEDAVAAAGLTVPQGTRWMVLRGPDQIETQGVLSSARDVSAVLSGDGFALTTGLLSTAPDPGATSCADITADVSDCSRQPQDDGSVLFELRYEDDLLGYRLLHPRGWVAIDVQAFDGTDARVAPADPDRLRALVLDPSLRW